MSKRDALPFSTTLHVRDSCLCLHTQRAARAIARRFDEALRPAHLTSGQFSLLMSLNRPAPPRIGEVAALLATDRTTLTANLKPLQRRGLVSVTIDDADKRGRRLSHRPRWPRGIGFGAAAVAADTDGDRTAGRRCRPATCRPARAVVRRCADDCCARSAQATHESPWWAGQPSMTFPYARHSRG